MFGDFNENWICPVCKSKNITNTLNGFQYLFEETKKYGYFCKGKCTNCNKEFYICSDAQFDKEHPSKYINEFNQNLVIPTDSSELTLIHKTVCMS